MCQRFDARRKRGAIAISFALTLAACLTSSAADESDDRLRLTAISRQLDLIERLAREGQAAGFAEGARYHFDYARLREDLARMRTGIEDYLTPTRAQPRDPSSLDGYYQHQVQR